MDQLQRHHHFRADQVAPDDRVAQLEMRVVELLLRTDVPDDRRDSSIAWELKHQAAVTQLGRLLAEKRRLNPEIGAVGALLHDIYTVVTGSYDDHARRGGPIASDLLESVGGFKSADRAAVNTIVVNHSDKHVFSDDPWAEFGKDVDVLDCFLYPHALDEYLLVKPLDRVKQYLSRAKRVWVELGVAPHAAFSLLDDYTENRWLSECKILSQREALQLVHSAASSPSLPPFALAMVEGSIAISFVPGAQKPLTDVILSGSDMHLVESSMPPFTESKVAVVWPAIGRYQLLGAPFDADSATQETVNISRRPSGRLI